MKNVMLVVALKLSLITVNAFGASVNLDGLSGKQKAVIMLQAANWPGYFCDCNCQYLDK